MKRLARALAGSALALAALLPAAPAAAAVDKAAVATTYADIARAMYEDALTTAKDLDAAIDALAAEPGAETLAAAQAAWLAARKPYQQTEAYRFGNAVVDGWEGRVNAWPLDEGLIDYVDASYGADSAGNPLYTANVIANSAIKRGADAVDVSDITPALLADTLQEIGGVEANVATGYHAIEFLLWGQDLNGTGPGAGARPWTDYSTTECSNGNCERRAQYLGAASDLLVDDLAWMAAQWAPGGAARRELEAKGPDGALATILTGIGSLSYGELAGERMKLGLLLHDPEEEHDCFSDNTFNSHYYDILGMRAVYFASYTRIDGSKVEGASPAELLAETDAGLAAEMKAKLDATLAAAEAMKARGETVEAYDQMIGADNPEGNAAVQAVIDGLTDQTRSIERAVAALGLETIRFEGSDSLDNPEAVFE